MIGLLGNSAINNTGLNLQATGNIPAAALLGAAPVGSLSIPVLGGLPSGGLQIPMPTSPSIDTIGVPSECLLLKNMFDPENEVARLLSYTWKVFVILLLCLMILLALCTAERPRL
jgi:RNA-binding protein 39